MKPILILQHDPLAAPGYFAEWVRTQGWPIELVRIDRGEAVPVDPTRYAGLCSMGGSMSVYDPLPWVEQECRLMRAADAAGVPIIGHCLGGQLLARALGATVRRHMLKEIGWVPVTSADPALAREWLGTDAPVEMFQWHGDTFALPAGAQRLLTNAYCAEQAYVIDRGTHAHLGMQFHCEMTPALIDSWLADGTWVEEIAAERAATGGPAVQDPDAMRAAMAERTARMNALAARLYARWARGLAS